MREAPFDMFRYKLVPGNCGEEAVNHIRCVGRRSDDPDLFSNNLLLHSRVTFNVDRHRVAPLNKKSYKLPDRLGLEPEHVRVLLIRRLDRFVYFGELDVQEGRDFFEIRTLCVRRKRIKKSPLLHEHNGLVAVLCGMGVMQREVVSNHWKGLTRQLSMLIFNST